MISIRQITAIMCLTASTLSAQTTYLSEDFTNGVPPAGWTRTQVSGSNGWISGGTRAWHEDEANGLSCDSYLISPIIDLSTATNAYLHFAGETYYTTYLANHPTSSGDGVSTIEVSTDGGISWTILWTDTSQNNNDTYAPNLGLNAYIGSSNVQVSMHYYGTFAHEWWVDYLIIDDSPVPTLAQATNPDNGHPYTLLGASDFASAQAVAQSMGGHLVSITDLAENTWVRNEFSTIAGVNDNLWLGYTDVQVEGTFEWSNGEVTGYTNWQSGEPNNSGNEDYVQMNTSNGLWQDVDGIVMGHGIVEISEPSLQITPLVAGGLATFTSGSFPSGSRLVYIVSINGAGPSNTQFGVLYVDLDIISPFFPDNNGSHSISTYVPSGLGGSTLYAQTVVFEPDGDVTLSRPIAEPIQ